MDELKEIRERVEEYENNKISAGVIFSVETLRTLFDKIDADAKNMAEYKRFLQQYKDALASEEDDNEQLDKLLAEGREIVEILWREVKKELLDPEKYEEFYYLKLNEWLKKVK